jgi:O-antigen/teichoic acid export membrane protein
VVFSTQLWGKEGRGMISIIIADMSIIAIINNILGGSSINYFTPKIGFEKLIIPAYIWIFFISFFGTLLFYISQPQISFTILAGLTILNSLFTVNLLVFASKQNFKLYNIFSLLLPIITLGLMFFFEYVLILKSYFSYLYSYCITLCILWIASLYYISVKLHWKKVNFSIKSITQVITYGWQTELSSLIHFINYRISYFLILYYSGIGSVGVYSTAIAIAEAIWIIVSSISTIQYSQIVNNHENSINLSINYAKLSFYLSLSVALILVIIPAQFYVFLFGSGFTQIKNVIYLILPGILSMSISNIYGHYFSAIGKTKVLIYKSIIGLLFTFILSPLLLPRYGIYGACIVTSTSYIVSSLYLFICFYRQIPFSIDDLIPNKNDFRNLLNNNKI